MARMRRRNALPFDPNPPNVASGIRIGTPATTTRAFGACARIFSANTCAGCASVLLQSIARARAEIEAEVAVSKEKESKVL